MALWCRFIMRFLMLVWGILKFVCFSMECSCIAPLTLGVMVMRRLVFHPLYWMVLINGSYLACFCVMPCFENLSPIRNKCMGWFAQIPWSSQVASLCVLAPEFKPRVWDKNKGSGLYMLESNKGTCMAHITPCVSWIMLCHGKVFIFTQTSHYLNMPFCKEGGVRRPNILIFGLDFQPWFCIRCLVFLNLPGKLTSECGARYCHVSLDFHIIIIIIIIKPYWLLESQARVMASY